MRNKGFCRTAPATPEVLVILQGKLGWTKTVQKEKLDKRDNVCVLTSISFFWVKHKHAKSEDLYIQLEPIIHKKGGMSENICTHKHKDTASQGV